jgi:hypothetical protein
MTESRSGCVAKNGSVAKNIMATPYSIDEQVVATTPCMVSEFLQQTRILRKER